jgi:anti-sigma regulatory factor (Ser/Thr protein kinase)/CBS domain-containing protein
MPMNVTLPFNVEKAPNVIMEVIFRLKVHDAMSKDIYIANKKQKLREIQQVMKKEGISGVPIVEKERLVGMISVNDIMTALDKGYIEEPAAKYMAKQLLVLEDDMPLTFAISYFNKYPYRRFPVIDKDQKFVGILSSKDILVLLVNEMNNEISDLEKKITPEKIDLPSKVYNEFFIKKFDFENAGHPSFELKKLLKEKNIPKKIIRRASIASYEMEINVAIHSDGGRISFLLDKEKIIIEAKDNGPGIANVEQVLEPGFSTANDWIRSLGFGAGMGIPNTKRVSDEFDIESEVGKGTIVKSTIYLELNEDKDEDKCTS